MRPRPVRPNVYLPVVRFGVISSDWKFVLILTLVGYTIPFVFGLRFWGVPLELWTGLMAAALSITFFNYTRIGRRPYWLQHRFRALVENPCRRRTLPGDWSERPKRRWITTQ